MHRRVEGHDHEALCDGAEEVFVFVWATECGFVEVIVGEGIEVCHRFVVRRFVVSEERIEAWVD